MKRSVDRSRVRDQPLTENTCRFASAPPCCWQGSPRAPAADRRRSRPGQCEGAGGADLRPVPRRRSFASGGRCSVALLVLPTGRTACRLSLGSRSAGRSQRRPRPPGRMAARMKADSPWAGRSRRELTSKGVSRPNVTRRRPRRAGTWPRRADRHATRDPAQGRPLTLARRLAVGRSLQPICSASSTMIPSVPRTYVRRRTGPGGNWPSSPSTPACATGRAATAGRSRWRAARRRSRPRT